MERNSDICSLLDRVVCPAFIVENGIITEVNPQAAQLPVKIGTDIHSVIDCGHSEYTQLTDGQLCLSLHIGDIALQATVDRTAQCDIFYLESDYNDLQMRTLALVSQTLREPLANALNCTDLLADEVTAQANGNADDALQMLKKNLYRLHRAMCNMSDVPGFDGKRAAKIENCDLTAFFDEVISKAQALTQPAGLTLEYQKLCPSVICMADCEKLERAVLNLISNAAKFSVQVDPIHITLEKKDERILFSVVSTPNQPVAAVRSSLFDRFRRAPGIESALPGIGLGMSIIRSAAISHGGTLLIDTPETDKIRFLLTIPIKKTLKTAVHTKILALINYTGGYDHALTELSDILPAELFR